MTVIASEAKQSSKPRKERLDCFVALLLAMTLRDPLKCPTPRAFIVLPSTICAAKRRTRCR